jgi:cell division septum initiation protein DivIVA
LEDLWRVKFSYSLYNKSQFSDLSIVEINNKDFNKFLYGLSFRGYNTVNVYAYYGLNSILKQQKSMEKDKYEGI